MSGEGMNKRFGSFISHQLNVVALIVQILFIGIATLVFLALAVTVVVFQWNQMNRVNAPSSITASPATSASSSSSNSQDSQILSEAQQDVNVASNIIAWSGFFLAIMASAVTVAGFFGIREFWRIRHLSNEFEQQIQDVNKLKTQVENDLQRLHIRLTNESLSLIEIAYNFGLASNAYKVGDYARAIEYYLQILDAQPDNKLVLERLGRAYTNNDETLKGNETLQGIAYLEKALAIDSSYVPALRSLALCYRYTDKDKAIATFQKAIEIEPSDYETWDFLGLIYRDNKQIDEAIAAHEQALTLKRRPETQFYLSILYALKGDMKRAKLMGLNAEEELNRKEHDERVRPVWKNLIRAGAYILEGNENEAYKLVQTLSTYVTKPRVREAVTGHLHFLLEATGHDDWEQKFTAILQIH